MDQKTLEQLKSKYKLSDKEHDAIYEAIERRFFFGLEPASNPSNIIMLGQNGSGKSTLASFLAEIGKLRAKYKELPDEEKTKTKVYEMIRHERIKQKLGYLFEENTLKYSSLDNDTGIRGNTVSIDGDLIRSYHPAYDELRKEYPREHFAILAQDTEVWTKKLFLSALEKGYNTIYSITTKDIDKTIEYMSILKRTARPITFKVLAVNELESMLSIFERYGRQIKVSGYGRLNDYAYHDDAYRNTLYVLDQIERYRIGKTEVYNREFECVYDSSKGTENKYRNAREAVEEERRKSIPKTLKNFDERLTKIKIDLALIPDPRIEPQIEELERRQERYLEEIYGHRKKKEEPLSPFEQVVGRKEESSIPKKTTDGKKSNIGEDNEEYGEL